MEKGELIKFFDESSKYRDKWRKKNRYYHRELFDFFAFHVPENSKVLEIGCSTGDLLHRLKPSIGIGVDISPQAVDIAKKKYNLKFVVDDIENLRLDEKFDFIIMQDLICSLSDIWLAFRNLKKLTTPDSRIIITTYNHLWEPFILLAEALGLKAKEPYQNWLSMSDIENLLYLNRYEVVKKGYRFLMPLKIPFISSFINKYLAQFPLIKHLCLVRFLIAKETGEIPAAKDYSVSIIIPARNEKDNIREIIERTPSLGKKTELIFVDGDSTDGTVEEILECAGEYPEKNIKLVRQGGAFGKADAVRKGFEAANGEILMILDADITVAPEDLAKFYLAISENKGEMINGSRLVYPMEKGAMRILNMLGNKFFSIVFSWILEQRIKDTLCGTKILSKENYLKIKKGRTYFGDFDPFGDFDLLFGASKCDLKIVEMPVRYQSRKYGTTKISRFRHGLLLLKMSVIAFRKLKFN